jgi:proteasome lid subunit RPN8/RPN11
MIDHLQSVLPEEGCGLLGGHDSVATRVFPIENVLHSQTRFRMHPVQQVQAIHTMLDADMELVGIFHSHPEGPAGISMPDIQEVAYPQAAYLIFWLDGDHWRAGCFSLVNRTAAVMDLVIN